MLHNRSPRATAGLHLFADCSLHGAGLALLLGLLACGDGTVSQTALEEGEHLPGGEATTLLAVGRNAFIRPLENLEREHRGQFFFGDSLFDQSWVVAPASTVGRDGLGPLFNSRSCSSCHPLDGRGSPPVEGETGFGGLLLRLSIPGVDSHGGPLPEPNYGGQLQPFAVGDVPGEASQRVEYSVLAGQYEDGQAYELLEPEYHIEDPNYGPLASDVLVSPRVGPAVIGLGLLEAIDEADLVALADPDDQDQDGISGRLNRVWDARAEQFAAGRFGWKAEQPSLRQQSAGAYLGDLGITTELFAEQNCTTTQVQCQQMLSGGEPELAERSLDAVELYMRALAVPARADYASEETLEGKGLFDQLGCSGCHTPSFRTAQNASLVELQSQLIWPYTDLLLHDMGEGLADNRPVFEASGSEWRTPPLWGLGRYEAVNGHERLLHDGRARGVAEAILWHGGEAEASAEAFRLASPIERRALVRFVRSL